ncbi:MAG TPA: hypothetical protein VFF06_25425 [Polyangia bacterium]|nr:hypothetical protein [Polyangia bacterium]
MSRLARFAVAAILIAVPAAARAQQNGADLDYNALTKAPAGAWAEYTMTMKNMPPGPDGKPAKPMKMRYALVDKTPKLLTIEIDTATPMGEIQVQMKYEPAGPEAWKVASGKMRMGTQTMELQKAQIEKSGQVTKDPNAMGKLLGTESVKTPAGTFECRHYSKTVQDQSGASLVVEMWISDKVQPAGMVKSVAKDKGIEVLLAATGKDATAKMK